MPGGVISLGDIQSTLTIDGFNEFSQQLGQADNQLSTFSGKLGNFGTKAKKIGGDLTRSLTLPIVGAGAAALKVAADFEVSSRKFAKAFEGVSDQANESVSNLNQNFGIANSQATQLLANTGDLLKGFGASSAEALNLANATQEVAIALSAYNGVPVAQTSEAVTKALLGETESLKQLGVVIRQSDVDARLLADGNGDLIGQARLLAKAQATLALTYEQSGDAVASFADNQDTLSFQTQALFGDLKDLGVQIGTDLIPIAKDMVAQVGQLIEFFGNLDEGNKKLVLTLAGIAAAAGPVIGAIGAISTALAFLVANPAVAAVAAVAAVTVAVIALNNAAKEKALDEFIDKFGDVAEIAALTDEELQNLSENQDRITGIFSRLQGLNLSTEDLAANVAQVAASFNISEETLLEILDTSESLTQTFKDQLTGVDELILAQNEELALINTITVSQEEGIAAANANYQARIQAINAAKEELELARQAREEANNKAVEDQIKARLKALEAYNEAVRTAEVQNQLGLIDTIELEEERLAASEKYVDSLIAAGYDGADATQIGNQALNEQIELLKKAQAETDKLAEEEKALEEERKLRAEQQQNLETFFETANTALNFASYISGTLQGIIEDNQKRVQENLEEEFSIFQETKGKELEVLLQKEESSKALTESEQKRLEDLKDEKNKLLKEQYEAEKEQFRTQQNFAVANAIIAGAQGAINAYNSLASIPVVGVALGIVAAAAVAVFTGIQVANIKKQKPPKAPTYLADGAVVQGRFGQGVNTIIGEAGPEAVIPLNDDTFKALGDGIIESQQAQVQEASRAFGGAGNITIVLQGLGQLTIPITQDALDNRQIIVPSEALAG